MDNQLYRVNVICECRNDLAFGYGPTIEAARKNAMRFFRKQHGRGERISEEIVEKATEMGTHSRYVEVGA